MSRLKPLEVAQVYETNVTLKHRLPAVRRAAVAPHGIRIDAARIARDWKVDRPRGWLKPARLPKLAYQLLLLVLNVVRHGVVLLLSRSSSQPVS